MVKWTDPSNWYYGEGIFPLMQPDELEALTEDIRVNGLLNPVIRCAGKILDGRNRALATHAAGKELVFRDVSKSDAERWARSQNVFRRSLIPTHQAFALEALRVGTVEEKVSKKTLKARHKLKALKEALPNLLEKTKNGEDISKELLSLLKPKKKEKSPLYQRIHESIFKFLPTISDGKEHVFIDDMALALITVPNTEPEIFYKNLVVQDLKEIAQSFISYASKLEAQ